LSNEIPAHPDSDVAPSSQPSQQSGIVYVLTNPAMPDMVKFGSTGRSPAAQRLRDPFSTGMLAPFQRESARRLDDSKQVEAVLLTAFAPQRIDPQREFFETAAARSLSLSCASVTRTREHWA
jgi:hypothetical protein